MKIKALERRIRQLERERAEAREQAAQEWQMRFIRESMADKELTDLMYPLVQTQIKYGFDSLEAEAAYDEIKDEYERILETRYPWTLEEDLPEPTSWPC